MACRSSALELVKDLNVSIVLLSVWKGSRVRAKNPRTDRLCSMLAVQCGPGLQCYIDRNPGRAWFSYLLDHRKQDPDKYDSRAPEVDFGYSPKLFPPQLRGEDLCRVNNQSISSSQEVCATDGPVHPSACVLGDYGASKW